MCSSPCLFGTSVLIRSGHAGPSPKAPVERVKTFERVKQFQTYLAHLFAGPGKLFRVLDCEPDSVNRDSGLIGHPKFNR